MNSHAYEVAIQGWARVGSPPPGSPPFHACEALKRLSDIMAGCEAASRTAVSQAARHLLPPAVTNKGPGHEGVSAQKPIRHLIVFTR